MKQAKKLLALLVVLSMLLVACSGSEPAPAPAEEEAEPAATEAPAEEEPEEEEPEEEEPEEPASETDSGEKTVLNVWSFTNEIMTMAIAFEEKNPNVDVVYTMIPMTNGEYQTKLKAALGTADAPDVIALEASFVKEFVEADFLADLDVFLPEAEALQTYPFVIDVGTHDGVVKAFSYQATPGALFYRRSLANEYFGTDDPAEMQALLSDMDKFTEAAAVVKEKSGGDTYMVASNGDFQNPFFANRAEPWIVDDSLVIDPMVAKYVQIAKQFRDEGYEAQAAQWQEGWFAGMNDSLVDAEGNPKQIFSYFLPTWGLPYVLAPNAASADGSTDTSGDWGVITGPLPYQWGGTWVGAMKESDNLEMAAEFVRFATLDEENMTNWATGVYSNDFLKAIDPDVPDDQQQAAGDFVSSQVVVEKIVSSFDDSELSAFLDGQNSYAGFAEAAPTVNAKLMTGSDDAIQRALGDPLSQYLNDEISEEDMWNAWKDNLRIEFPDLLIGDEVPSADDATLPAASESAASEEAAPSQDAVVSEEEGTLNIWSFTNEIMTMATAFQTRYPNVDVTYTMIPMTNGEYQTKLKAALGTADAPDVIALEASFVKEFVEADFLADLGEFLPDAEKLETYPFVIEVGTHDGVTKGYAYQATPGALFYRRSLAEEYFGTDDPAEMQELLSDMDKFTEAAAVIKEKSGGDVYMVASNGDFQNPFFANRAEPWIVDETLVIDPMVEEYVKIAKLFRDEGYEAQAAQWQEGWFAGMNDSLVDAEGNAKQIFSYFLPTWGLPYVLAPNAASADGGSDTTGDWGVITGPLPYQWGGTWMGAMEESPNLDLAKEFIRFATLDEENLTNWATGVYSNDYLKAIDPDIPDDQEQAAGDFVSSQVVVNKIVSSFDDGELSAFLDGQNSYAGFAEAAPTVNAKLMTGSDDAIQRALGDPLSQYLNGEISEDDMWAAWKDNLRIEFPDLIIP